MARLAVRAFESARERAWRGRPGRWFGVKLVALVGLVVAWQLLPNSAVPADVVGRPAATAIELLHLIVTGQISLPLLVTGLNIALGLGIGAVIGCGVAVIGSVPVLEWLLEPIMTLANAVPKVGVISILILLLGLTLQSHVALVIAFTTFVFYYNCRQGLREIDRPTVIALQLLGARRNVVLRLYSLPALVPYLLTAVRVGAPLAFGAEIFAELEIPASGGLGGLLLSYSSALDAAGSMAVLVLVGALAYMLDIVILGRLGRYAQRTGAAGMRL